MFLAVPAVTVRYPFWGRVILVVAGTGNTMFCTWLLGELSGTQVFLLPCVSLAALLFRRDERMALFGLLMMPTLAGVALDGRFPVSPFVCTGAACAGIVRLNAFSVAILTAFLGLLATGLVSDASVGVRPTPRPKSRPP